MFGRRSSIKLLDVFGIRIGVDGTWFVLLFLLIFLFSPSFRSALHSSDGVAYLTCVVTVLLYFGSLILHELGHAFAARRQGIRVERIELFLFGGLAQMSREAQTPGEEFKVAVAGPLATFAFLLLCLAADLILVIQGGRVVERGTHASLLAAGGVYARLSAAQFQDIPEQDGPREVLLR